jgi:hypothetical protein
LSTQEKYYPVDLGLRYALLGKDGYTKYIRVALSVKKAKNT